MLIIYILITTYLPDQLTSYTAPFAPQPRSSLVFSCRLSRARDPKQEKSGERKRGGGIGSFGVIITVLLTYFVLYSLWCWCLLLVEDGRWKVEGGSSSKALLCSSWHPARLFLLLLIIKK